MLNNEVEKLRKALSAEVQPRGLLGVVSFGRTPGQDPKLAVRIYGDEAVIPPAVQQLINEISQREIGRVLSASDMDVMAVGKIQTQAKAAGI
jgi:hypothetical protein